MQIEILAIDFAQELPAKQSKILNSSFNSLFLFLSPSQSGKEVISLKEKRVSSSVEWLLYDQ